MFVDAMDIVVNGGGCLNGGDPGPQQHGPASVGKDSNYDKTGEIRTTIS